MSGERQETSKLAALIQKRDECQRQCDELDQAKEARRLTIYDETRAEHPNWPEERVIRYSDVQLRKFDSKKDFLIIEIDAITKKIHDLQKPTVCVYQDEQLMIETEVVIPDDKVALQSLKSVFGDAIRFTGYGSDVHFIQFVTHQFVESTSGNLRWGKPKSNYMTNLMEPRWRVDTAVDEHDIKTLPLPFYELYGVYDRNPNALSIYDEPGTTMMRTERAVFATFLINDDKPLYEIRWSRQYDLSGKLVYQIGTPHRINKLPDWALLVIKEDIYQTNSHQANAVLKYQLPPGLDREVEVKKQTSSAFKRALFKSFLPADNSWWVKRSYPRLFQPHQFVFFAPVPYPSLLKRFGLTEQKVTGPKVAEVVKTLHSNNEIEKAIELARQFCDWAKSYQRHFNLAPLQELIKQYEAVNSNQVTKLVS